MLTLRLGGWDTASCCSRKSCKSITLFLLAVSDYKRLDRLQVCIS